MYFLVTLQGLIKLVKYLQKNSNTNAKFSSKRTLYVIASLDFILNSKIKMIFSFATFIGISITKQKKLSPFFIV